MKNTLLLITLVVSCLMTVSTATARTVEYDLVLAETQGPAGARQKAMTINGTLPGPTLRFTEGDDAVMRVRNDLREDTSIHWHGLLVPNDQDGVPHVNMAPIRPGETREYRFRLRHSGTYWYHSHSVLQEQLGIYGGIVITPKGGERIKTSRDAVVMLSDWTDEKPYDVLTQLRAGREWQGIKKGTAQSWLGAWQHKALGSYFKRSLMRMPPMDLSDVAYRHFLVNGEPESSLAAKAGETVRVRLINASAATYYFIEFAGGPVKIIAADGVDVQPVAPGRFMMAIAETYDLLVKVPAGGAYELRATTQDGSGKSSFFIGRGERRLAPDVPRANLYMNHGAMNMGGGNSMGGMDGMSGMDHSKMQMEGDAAPAVEKPISHEGMDHGAKVVEGQGDGPEMDHAAMKHEGMEDMKRMDHSKMKMPAKPENGTPNAEEMPEMDHSKMKMPAKSKQGEAAQADEMAGMDHGSMPGMKMKGMDHAAMGHSAGAAPAQSHNGHAMTNAERPGSPYEMLRAVRSTRISDDRPLREYTFRLQGNMIRYVWTLDGKTLTEADTINVRRGERVQFKFINETMMHHPMHLHGHFFRVLTGAGDFSPLKHTVDVPPFESRTIEFAADEPGDWMMHCHILYHAEVGMARVVHYEDAPLPSHLHGVSKFDMWTAHDPIFFFGEGTALSQMSDGFLTLQNNRNALTASWEVGWGRVDKTGYEVDLTYDRYIGNFASVFAGAEFTNGEAGDRGIFGVRYLLPLMIQSQAWVDTEGDFRLALTQSIALTPRLAVFGGAEYDTLTRWEGVAGLEYVLGKRFSLIGQWHSEYGPGGGLSFRF
jgi:FtsP/CotA-like multicopper oxidase with cupredoxin domain